MARRTEATREAVWEAMERLRGAADPRWDSPTRLRAAIGGVGSFTTITQHRDAWRAAHENDAAADAEGPVEVPPEARDAAGDAITKAVEQTWRTARDHAAALTEQVRRKAAEDVAVARRDRDEALDEARRLERELADADGELEKQRERIKKLDDLSSELAASNKGLREQVDQALLVIRDLQESASKVRLAADEREGSLRADLERAAEREAALNSNVTELKARVAAAEELAKAQAGETEKARREAAEAELQRQSEAKAHAVALASLQGEHKEKVVRLGEQLASAQKAVERLDQELAKALRDNLRDDLLKARESAAAEAELRLRELERRLEGLVAAATKALETPRGGGTSP
jgi:chromosome segregation ATPase